MPHATRLGPRKSREIEGGRLKEKNSDKRLAKDLEQSHAVRVIAPNILSVRLRMALQQKVEAEPELWCGVTGQALDTIADACIELLTDIAKAEERIVDPASGLELPPPPPQILYKNRKSLPDLRSLPPEDFIGQTDWRKWRDAGLLYSEFIRQADMSLYTALNGRARYQGRAMSEFMESNGILTRRIVDHPPPELLRQVRLIRAAQVQSRPSELRAPD